MFDPVTSALVATAPPLDDLDLGELPKQLTVAYVEIVSARIRLRQSPAEATDTLTDTIAEMRRLAATQEALVALVPDRENRAAAAFVAASAHQVCLLAEQPLDEEENETRIDIATIAPEVCATLLYLIAAAHADAAEAAKRISPAPGASACERTLLLAIAKLAEGKIGELLNLGIPQVSVDTSQPERAVEALFLLLFKGVRALALRLMRRIDRTDAIGMPEPAASFFERVKELTVEDSTHGLIQQAGF